MLTNLHNQNSRLVFGDIYKPTTKEIMKVRGVKPEEENISLKPHSGVPRTKGGNAEYQYLTAESSTLQLLIMANRIENYKELMTQFDGYKGQIPTEEEAQDRVDEIKHVCTQGRLEGQG